MVSLSRSSLALQVHNFNNKAFACVCVCAFTEIDMSRFNNKKRMIIITHLLERDGNLCQGCENKHGFASTKDMRIDHLDGEKDHNCLLNLRLTCNAFNVQPRPSARPYVYACACGYRPNQTLAQAERQADQGIKVKLDDLEASKSRTATMRTNDRCEKPFNKWLNQMLDNGEAYSYDEYANAGSFKFECSSDTIKRYLNKRLDLPECNPINGDLILRLGPNGRLCLTWKDKERWYFKK